MARKPFQIWIATIGQSILGPVVVSVRQRGGRRMLAREAPDHVRQYLGLPAKRNVRPVIDGLSWADVQELTADRDSGQGNTRVRVRQYQVIVEFRVSTPNYRPPRPKLTVREHGRLIRDFRGLLNYFSADRPDLLNKRIYKATDCGASISIYLRGESRGIHNGDPRWASLTGREKLDSFTIQTIVEGSEATVDSDHFLVPCTAAAVEAWIVEMEAEASAIWEEANADEDGEDE